MSRVRSFTFGPGSLESIELRMWLVPRRDESWTKLVKARVVGGYRVYCGNGWEHQVDVDEIDQVDLERAHTDEERRLVAAWRHDDPQAAEDTARVLIEWSLEDWEDPCGTDEGLPE